MTPQEEAQQHAIDLLEQGKEGDGTTLTKEQCALLLEYMDERFSDGYSCGSNNAVFY